MQIKFLHKSEIISQSEKLLSDYFIYSDGVCIGKSAAEDSFQTHLIERFPLDLEGLVFDFLYERDGVGLDDEKDLGHDEISGEKILGKTIPERKKIEIDVSLQAPSEEGRRNFTIAHEIGHWILHVPIVLQEARQSLLFKDTPRAFVSLNRNISAELFPRLPPEEWQTNFFAANLLMPEDAVRTRFLELTESVGLPAEPINLRDPKTIASLLERCASISQLSAQVYYSTFAPESFTTLRDLSLFAASRIPTPSGKTLHQSFGVSKTAMAIRLEQVGVVREEITENIF